MKQGLHWHLLFNEDKASRKVEIDVSTPGDRFLYSAARGVTSECAEGQPIQFAGYEMKIIAMAEGDLSMTTSAFHHLASS